MTRLNEYGPAPMQRIVCAATRAGLLATLIVVPAVQAQATDLVPIDQVGSEYVKPHQRIDVGGGRRMNLHCMGSGGPTVVFESGLSDWSSTWALIQPAIAKSTRACSYDRPGMGYSDPVPGSRTPEDAIKDLKRLLDGAGIKEPIVLVGHSLGGFYAKLFAATYPDRIAGLVLVDPSEERLLERVGPSLASRFDPALVQTLRRENDEGIAALMAHFRECAADAHAGGLTEARYKKCTDPVRAPLGSAILAERRILQATPAYQDAQSTELADSVYGKHPEADARYARLFAGEAPLGDIPLLVLTHGLWDMADPTGEVDYQSWRQAHVLTAALSRRGTQEMVPNTRHNIQIDNPAAVVDAVERVLKMLPGSR